MPPETEGAFAPTDVGPTEQVLDALLLIHRELASMNSVLCRIAFHLAQRKGSE